ncbi:MAG: methionyl-tRNA formyltransferase [bacterium]|nr:methionyl-tRNA formyltransferase [bacterium]
MEKDVRIIFWGTPKFAIPAFEALLNSGYKIVAVITNPDEPVGRNHVLTPPPMKSWIMNHEAWNKIPVLQPVKLDSNFMVQVSGFMSDVFIVAAYGKIIPKEIIELPRLGSLNIHPSLLPRWRGPSPIQTAILEGDTETGVTLMLMDEKMDHGPIIKNIKFRIQNHKITHTELSAELAGLGARLLIETLPSWLSGEIKPAAQDESRATYSKILKKEDGKIDWEKKSAVEIERMVRAYSSWPGSYTFWQRGENKLRLEIEEAEVATKDHDKSWPGLVWKMDESPIFFVQTRKGSLCPLRVHPEGKKSLSAEVFLNGYKDIIGIGLE